jgi:argininosuccinate lyase
MSEQKESSKTLSYIVSEGQKKADSIMAAYDTWATQAHVAGLGKVGIMNSEEVKVVLQALDQIKYEAEQGNFPLDPKLGAQLTLEKLVTDQVGKVAGGKIHTGRSRNDQVTVAQKLYVRDAVLVTVGLVQKLIDQLVTLAAEHIETVMPGYTHMQPAKPTTLGQWCLSYGDMLFRGIDRIEQTYKRHNTCPLGAAESYGTSWPLDRQYVAHLLAFDSVHEVPADAIGTRGEMEVELMFDFSLLMLHCSKIAQDVLFMVTFESSQVILGEDVAEQMGKLTGSSIMPQKKNPDVLELVRANTSIVYGQLWQGLEVLKALPMGYNRDTRETKELIMTSFQRTNETIEQLSSVFGSLYVNKERMSFLVKENYSLSTDLADYLAQKYNLPYRMLYTVVGKLVKKLVAEGKKLFETTPALLIEIATVDGLDLSVTQADIDEAIDPVKALSRRTHIGGAAMAQMQSMIAARKVMLAAVSQWVEEQQEKIGSAKEMVGVLTNSL